MSSQGTTTLYVRVTPNARRSEWIGRGMDEKGREVFLLKLAAPPVDGKANEALIRFIAETLKCPRSQVSILRGEGSRQKVLEVPVTAISHLPI